MRDLISEVQSVYSQIPDSTDLYNVEDKLDKLIELMNEQCEISKAIVDRLDSIHMDLPDDSRVSTSRMETLLDRLCDKIDESNSQLGYIEGNTRD